MGGKITEEEFVKAGATIAEMFELEAAEDEQKNDSSINDYFIVVGNLKIITLFLWKKYNITIVNILIKYVKSQINGNFLL